MSALEPLRHKNFRWLFGGRFTTFLGNAVAPVALAFAVLDLTGSVTDLGLVVGARSVTNVLLMLFGGVLADRLPRAAVMRGFSLAAAGTQGVAAVLVLTHTASIPTLVVIEALNGAVSALAFPASSAVVPQTIPATLVRQANALLRLGINAALVGGAAAGGALVAAVGPGWGIAADAATFALSALCFARVRVPAVPPSGDAADHPIAQLREGWSEFRRRTWVWAVVLMAMVVNAVYSGGVVVLGPAVADDTIGRRAWGLVLAMGTLGMLVGGLVALRWQARHALGVGVALMLAVALPLVALAELPHVWALAGVSFVVGVALEQFGVAWDVSMQEHIPADKLARVYSYDALGSFVAIPLGEMVVGPVAHAVGTRTTLLGCAGIAVVATLVTLASRSVRQLTHDRPAAPPAPSQQAQPSQPAEPHEPAAPSVLDDVPLASAQSLPSA
jgi:MFS family permease